MTGQQDRTVLGVDEPVGACYVISDRGKGVLSAGYIQTFCGNKGTIFDQLEPLAQAP